ncbi:uncharacterized protein B0T23DRAFT_104076 [Neurospora hispaniola]|uniref:Uncharacterized protein n=1 Tax=Neurospora hispaniola TaxID=588809 RepID=A0AAJ0MS13_9PEZI|nr:hypothetical protein B0T23DRAFT_104076 [Neurospora hispaniola]
MTVEHVTESQPPTAFVVMLLHLDYGNGFFLPKEAVQSGLSTACKSRRNGRVAITGLRRSAACNQFPPLINVHDSQGCLSNSTDNQEKLLPVCLIHFTNCAPGPNDRRVPCPSPTPRSSVLLLA